MGQIFKKPINTDIPPQPQKQLLTLTEYKGPSYESSIKKAFPNSKNSNEVIRQKWDESNFYKVPTYEFREGKWQKMEEEKMRECNQKVEELKFMTYNVWFDDFLKEERYQVIMAMIEQSDAEFVCLQEVTQYFMQQLLSQTFIREQYFVSGNTIQGYGVLMISKFPSLFYEMPFPTLMGRSLLVCEPINGVNQQPTIIGTVHLESSATNFLIRQKQLQLSIDSLMVFDNHFIMGDFNFHSDSKDQQAVITDNGYSDVYLELNNGTESFTMLKTKEHDGWRPDKVIVPKLKSQWKPIDIQIVGKFSIPRFKGEDIAKIEEDGIKRTPSDHMALLTKFKVAS